MLYFPIWVIFTVNLLRLTIADTLCVSHDTSCAYQLWPHANVSKDACHMTHFRLNGTQCKSLQFASKGNAKDNLGDFRINSYLLQEYSAVLLNVTFSSIKWETATMRIMEKRDSNDIVCTARTFSLLKDPQNAILYYDCPFIDGTDDGRIFNVDLQLTKGSSLQIRKLLLRVPSYLGMDDNHGVKGHELFTYVDHTNPSNILLKIQPLNPSFNVTDYKVEVWRERDRKTSKMDVGFIDVASAIEGQLTYSYNTWQEWGDYYFVVSIVNDICPEDTDICVKTFTPKLTMDHRNNKLVIGIVGASVIIPILLYTVFMWNKQCKFQEALVDFSDIKVLLVYTPKTDSHNNVVIAFAQTLQKIFRMDVMMDIFDIPKTKHKNPCLWCSEALQQATHVIYVAPPNTAETYPSVYKTEAIALRFLEEYLASGRSDKKILCVTFPYSRKNIVELLKNFRHFYLMKEFSGLISYLVNYNRQNVFLCKSIFKRNQLMYYSEDSLYLDLVEAVKKAHEEVKLTKKLSKIKKPEIKILIPSEENIAGKEANENDTLIKKEGEYSVDIKELNLSGDKNDGLKEVALHKTGSFDVNDLDL